MTDQIILPPSPKPERPKPQVSIGMPVYNGAPFIRKALDSLLSQTFSDFELIISDNASTDQTGAICREYASRDFRIKYVRQCQNMGAVKNFQYVLDKARADHFMWAAADDMWDENFIAKTLSVLKADNKIDLVFSKFIILSRMYPLCSMRNFADMYFLSDPDPFVRISRFILLEEPSHKANLIYGLWRKEVLIHMNKMLCDLDLRFEYLGLDIAQLVFVLASSKAYQISEILFYKTYKRFPPGHPLSVILYIIMMIVREDADRARRINEHINLLQRWLVLSGIYNNDYERVLKAKELQELKRYSTLSAIGREILNSIRVL